MIIDTLKNASLYAPLVHGLDEGFGFLSQPGLVDLPDGKYEISGDRVFAMISHSTGRTIEEGQLEAHRKYLDIQYIIDGDESMGWSSTDGLTTAIAYDSENDLEFFLGTPKSITRVPSGHFALFLPTDAHLPLIGKGSTHKVVVKVAIGD